MRSAAQWSLSLALGSLLPVLPRVDTTGRTCNHSRACSPFFLLPSRLDTIGLDSMNELASATRARCVESSLIKGSSLLCRHLIHMHMLFLVSCRIFFCSRSRVFFTSPPFHSVRAVEPWIDISLFALFVLCYCPCSILLLLAIVPFRFQGK